MEYVWAILAAAAVTISPPEDRLTREPEGAKGKPKYTLRGSGRRISNLAFSPGSQTLAVNRPDGPVEIWDLCSRKLVRKLRADGNWFREMRFSPDGRYFAAAGSMAGDVRVWDLVAGDELVAFRGHRQEVYSVAFSPGSDLSVSGSRDQTARLWDTSTGKQFLTFEGNAWKPDPKTGLILDGWIGGVAFSPDGRRVASAITFCTGPGNVIIWDAATGKELVRLNGPADHVAFDPCGRTLATSHWEGLTFWDSVTGKQFWTFPVRDGNVECLAFSPQGRWLAAVCNGETASVWDPAANHRLLSVRGHESRVLSLSQDGRLLACSPDGVSVEIWEVPARPPMIDYLAFTLGRFLAKAMR